MPDNEKIETKSGGFAANLPSGFIQPTDAVGQRILKEYGAFFLARGGATPPNTAIFKSEAEVSAFQNNLKKSKEKIGNFDVELQSAAMKNLQEAVAEAEQNSLSITPRGADSAKRDYTGTVELWASRVNPGLANYVSKGKLYAVRSRPYQSVIAVRASAGNFQTRIAGNVFQQRFVEINHLFGRAAGNFTASFDARA